MDMIDKLSRRRGGPAIRRRSARTSSPNWCDLILSRFEAKEEDGRALTDDGKEAILREIRPSAGGGGALP